MVAEFLLGGGKVSFYRPRLTKLTVLTRKARFACFFFVLVPSSYVRRLSGGRDSRRVLQPDMTKAKLCTLRKENDAIEFCLTTPTKTRPCDPGLAGGDKL